MTAKEQSLMPADVAASKLFDALRAKGLGIERAHGVWTVSADDAHQPKLHESPYD